MLAADLTQHDFNAFSTIERVCSTLSLIGAFFIGTTYLGSKAFHKPINRLVFYASIGNMFTNVATLISRSALNNLDGPLCQFQAFLIQCFMPADSFWTLAMACNVYLTFYARFDEARLRRVEPIYMICCYGIPFVPALVYIWTKTAEKGRMYGNAALWCWVSSDWDIWRIATFYGPVWAVIAVTFGIYGRVGWTIYSKRKELRNFRAPPPDPIPIMHDPFTSVKTTEVFVTSEAMADSSDSIDLQQLNHNGAQHPRPPPQAAKGNTAYTVTVSSSQPNLQNQTRYSYSEKPLPGEERKASSALSPTIPVAASRTANHQHSSTYPVRNYASIEANKAMRSYTKVAGFFFIALLVTWIPSSANRVYSVVHPEQISLGLEYASAFVLPLQGFWNAIIYAMTSLPACKEVWAEITEKLGVGGLKFGGTDRAQRGGSRLPSSRGANKFDGESESMTELASRGTSSRPGTKGSDR